MPLTSSDFFVLRTPLFPQEQYKAIFEQDPAQLIAGQPLFGYALYIGSRELVKELNRFIEQPSEFNDKKIGKLKSSLYKYWVRACTRSTPYGVFAGCTLGTIGTETSLTVNGPEQAIQQVRLDMDYYTKVCNYILQEPHIRKDLRFYTNNSVYKIGDKFRYAEYTINNNRRKYLLSSITNSVFIEQIIAGAQSGMKIEEMIQLILTEDNTISAEEAEGFINELIDAQLLISEIEPRITGPDNLLRLIDRLSSLEDAKALRDMLLALSELFNKQDYDQQRLSEIHQQCETNFPIALPKDLLQIDLFKSAARCELSADMVNDITAKLSKLLAICNSYPSTNTELTNFSNKLNELYDGQEIPLNIALDAETGIGYGASIDSAFHTPFVEDVMVGGGSAGAQTINWSALQQLSLEKYEQFLSDKLTTVTITDEDLKKFGSADTVNFAESCFAFGSLHTGATTESGPEYLFSLQSLGGPSAANLLGRFCSGDPVMTEKVKELLRAEEAEDGDSLFAEVVHFPEARATNVLIRPILRPYEIPYVGVSSVDAEHQLPLSDLMVSIQRGNIVLRSKKWNKRVIPRLSSAHNYGYNSLPAYKFLCDLQQQSIKAGFYWDWGVCAGKAYLPRVVYHNIIISRASWELKQKDIDDLGKDKDKVMDNFTKFRAARNMPAQVTIADADNELFIDCTQPESLEILFEFVKKRQSVKLKEFLFGEYASTVKDNKGHAYTNEVLIPLQYKLKAEKDKQGGISFRASEQTDTTPRNYTPGSEWMYLKIYCGYALTEELLSVYFSEKIPEWKEEGLMESFFFLRYADPNPHLRLRFLNSVTPSKNDILLKKIFEDLQPYITGGQIKKIQSDTYQREIERYGATTMALSEQVFYADSMAVLGIVSMLEGPEGEEYRWKIAARGLDILLDDFGFSLPMKKTLMGNLQRGFAEEFGGPKLLNKQLNDKYRKYQKNIESFLNEAEDEQNEITDVIDIFKERSVINRSLAEEIIRLAAAESGNANQHWDLLSSYIHMYLNRLFVAKQRKHELIIYHFLEKYYTSKVAQKAPAPSV